MKRYLGLVLALAAFLLGSACAPPPAATGSLPQGGAQPAIQRTLVFVDAGENPDYATKQLTRASGGLFSSQARDLPLAGAHPG